MRSTEEKGIAQLESVKKRAARDYARGLISKQLLDTIDEKLRELIEIIKQGFKNEKESE